MSKIYSCIANAHDLRLVGLAVIICALASCAGVNLLRHSRTTEGHMRLTWLSISAMSTGFGIWATHFIAMLAFTPGIPSAYNIALTFISLLAAVLLTGAGFALSLIANWRIGPWLGGAAVGGGIAAMHYTGMAAFEIQGVILWDPMLVAASIILGAVIGAAALPVALRGGSAAWKYCGAALLTLAIASHHFTAMGAVSIIPDPTMMIPPATLPTGLLAISVALGSFIIILLALAGVALDLRDRQRSELETTRIQSLADAAVEGLLLCQAERVVTVNNSFAALAGLHGATFPTWQLASFFPDDAVRHRLQSTDNEPVETELRRTDGSNVPVEIIRRPMNYQGKPHHVIAVRDLRARKAAEQHIRYLAHHDALTGLPNRTHFNAKLDRELEQARASSQKLAVLCFDLDRFKEVNDLFGHSAGDKLLQSVARRVAPLLNERWMLARLGGDEFAIMIPDLVHPADAGQLAEQILDTLRQSGTSSDIEQVTCSIGVAIFPDDSADREDLLTQADTALYRAKSEGRATYRFFEARMGVEVRERRELEHELRHARMRQQLTLVFQPQQDLHSDEITGFEALLRWHHPKLGSISPAVFIPLAEETGAILDIGSWVLREACREAASWDKPLSIAVNVSAVQVHSTGFAQTVHQILLDTGLSPRRLELEITETALVRDLTRALTTLRQIKALGVRIAMDDFGTGYSSLSNLRAFPFDKIKIDGSFVKSVNANAQAATIVRAVLGLGRGLGLPVLAEGVETRAELSFLRNEGCETVQGYLLGHPSRIESYREFTHGDALPAPLLLAQSA